MTTLSASSLSSYSPISTLEQQYGSSGDRILLFVRTNGNCCLPGGVEALLKLRTTSSSNSHAASVDNSTVPSPPDASSSHNIVDDSDDPFAFLNSDDSSAPLPPAGTTSASTSTSSTRTKKNIGSWAKNVAKITTKNIERGMTGLAIRADQGRNPDTLVMCLRNNNNNQVIAMTEPQTLATNEQLRLQGCWFAIPLPLDTSTNAPNNNVTLQLYIRSGAALAKSKHYLLGFITLNVPHLQQALLQQHTTLMTLPLQSQVIVDGQVTICATNNLKFPTLYGRGWSMTDPDMSGYTTSGLYHLPLDQSYGYSIGKRWFLATERAMESTVILPIATAFSKLAANASLVSTQHASSLDKQLYVNRHDAMNVPEKATVNVSLGYLYHHHHTTVSANTQLLQAAVSLHWQRPDSMFEVELAPFTTLPISATTHTMPFVSNTNVSFSPPVCTTPQILPTILASYGGNGCTPPPWLLGNVRLLFRVSSSSSQSLSNINNDPFGSTTGTTKLPNMMADEEYWQAILPLEAYVNAAAAAAAGGGGTGTTPPAAAASPLQIPVYSCTATSTQVGTIVLQVQVTMPSARNNHAIVPSTGGLVSLVGLDTLMEDNGSLPMFLDYDTKIVPNDPALQRRQQQLQTMGPFVTHQYLQHHVSALRTPDCKMMQERAEQYQMVSANIFQAAIAKGASVTMQGAVEAILYCEGDRRLLGVVVGARDGNHATRSVEATLFCEGHSPDIAHIVLFRFTPLGTFLQSSIYRGGRPLVSRQGTQTFSSEFQSPDTVVEWHPVQCSRAFLNY